MKIVSFRVRKFRNIQDSSEIELTSNLNCIVGKNQSGKTSLLRALHKFNPHDKQETYNIRREWPRGERRKQNPKQVVSEIKFQLDPAEKEHLSTLASEKMTTDIVLVTKDYEGSLEIYFPEQPTLFPDRLHPNTIDRICADLPKLSEPVAEAFSNVVHDCKEELSRLAREGRFSSLTACKADHDAKLRAGMTQGNPSPQHQNETTFINEHLTKIDQISSELQKAPTMRREAHDYVVSQIPTFIYMDDYREFEGTAILDQVRARQKSKQPTADDETFLMILELAGLSLDDLIRQGQSQQKDELHERQLNLDDGARTLTKDVAGRWGQNPYQVEFRADGQTFFTEIEESGKQIGMIPLSEQSKGFRWFFSFDLRFMHDSEGTFEGCVLLLDEPGLHLHPGGQEDLLKRLDAYAEKNALIYTTHLPFLIDLREPSRIHVIREDAEGAVVTDDLSASGPDEKLTLQAALGMKLNQHFLVAQKNIVVEGADDFYILVELSNLFHRSSKQGIPNEIEISAAGGASEAVYLATFMVGQNLETVALFDSDKAGREAEERLRTKWLTRYKGTRSRTILLAQAAGMDSQEDFAIEDLFSESYYLERFLESHKEKIRERGIAEIKPVGNGLLCNRIGRACEQAGILYNKGSVAKLIQRDLRKMKDISELEPQTIEKATKLIGSLCSAFQR